MIIQKIAVNTFAGLTGKEMVFKEGLNVVAGPNESGKSSIFYAIENALFTPAGLTPGRLKKQVGRFFPVEGGDTIQVVIHFKSSGSHYILNRQWGARASSSLIIPGGAVVSDDDTIQSLIRDCMQVPEGTCRTVMMAYQSGLSKTVQDIQNDGNTVESLGDLLRNAVMEMDGVSVDAFRARIEESYKRFFGRWDIEAGYPEAGRGVENPWIKGTGTITDLFYEKERAKSELEGAVDYERELDDLNRRISSHAEEFEEAKSYVESYKDLKDDAVLRRQILADLKSNDLEFEKLEKVNKDWPVIEARVKEKQERISELEKRRKRIEKEKKEAEQYAEGERLLEKYERVEKRRKAAEEAEKALDTVGKLSGEDLKKIREAFSRKSRLEATLSAGAFFLRFTPSKDMDLEIRKGVEDGFRAGTKGGETFELQASGRVRVLHPEWEMEVMPGKVDYDQVSAEHEQVQSEIEGLLEAFNIKTLEEAEARNRDYEEKRARHNYMKSSMKDELGELTYAELRRKVEGLRVEKPDRNLERIIDELSTIRAEVNSLKRDVSALEEKLKVYGEDFGDYRSLLNRLTEVARLKKEKEERLGRLRPLPEGVEDVEEFIADYEKVESRLGKLKDEHNRLIQERIRIEGRAPERSVEEFERDFADAEERFEAELRKGLAIKRIRQRTEKLLAEMDRNTYSGLQEKVSKLIGKMTGGRYSDVVMSETLPTGFYRRDGLELPYDYLSAGTKDVLGLALRLAVTEEFLEGKEGFVMMDDPLVDLDPERQSRTVEAIREFAENLQVILLTCHPAHAEQLGGHQISLDR